MALVGPCRPTVYPRLEGLRARRVRKYLRVLFIPRVVLRNNSQLKASSQKQGFDHV